MQITTPWIPRERDNARFELKDLPRFFGTVWFPGPRQPPAASRPQIDDESPTQPEPKPNEGRSKETR